MTSLPVIFVVAFMAVMLMMSMITVPSRRQCSWWQWWLYTRDDSYIREVHDSLMTVFTIALMIVMFMMTMIAVVSMFDYSVMSIIELMTAKSGLSIVTSSCGSEIVFSETGFGSGWNINFGSSFSKNFGSGSGIWSGLFVKNTLKFTLFFFKTQRILHPYLNWRSSKLRKKASFFLNRYGTVHFYCFVCFIWKQLDLHLDSNPDPKLIRDSDADRKLQIISDPAGSVSTTLIVTIMALIRQWYPWYSWWPWCPWCLWCLWCLWKWENARWVGIKNYNNLLSLHYSSCSG